MYNGSASWIYTYPSPAVKDYISPPPPINVDSWRTIFYYNATTNSTLYNVSVYPLNVAGEKAYAGIYYIMRDGDATPIPSPSLRWVTCFNCHFVPGGGGGVSPPQGLEGYIPLPESALRSIEDPHSIQPLRVGNRYAPSGGGWGLIALLAAAATIITATAVLGRVRRE